MFTGIIKDVGRVRAIEPMHAGVRLILGTALFGARPVELGDSIAVNGVCLTVTAFEADAFTVEVSPETLRLTTLGALGPGDRVNLEPALRASDPLGGHIVSGHVDGRAVVSALVSDAEFWTVTFTLAQDNEAALARYLARKGSVAVDGVSLTINQSDASGFSVMLIPHTLAETRFADLTPGAEVNIEVDLMARYAERMLNT